jgi:dUTP pyrophosphatase
MEWVKLVAGCASGCYIGALCAELYPLRRRKILLPVCKVKTHNGVKPPYKATSGAAGYDLELPNDVIIYPGVGNMIELDLSFEIPEGYVGRITSRSSIDKLGLLIKGEIDSDYRGKVKLCVHNIGTGNLNFSAGDRIAQLIIEPIFMGEMEEKPELTKTTRGEGGYGSTNKV